MALEQADWRRLAEMVTKRRNALGMTQGEVHAAGGPSVATLRHIEGALQTTYQPRILSKLEAALGWEYGSINAILHGGVPTMRVEQVMRRGANQQRVQPDRDVEDLAEAIKVILDEPGLTTQQREEFIADAEADWEKEQAEAKRRLRERTVDRLETWKRARGA